VKFASPDKKRKTFSYNPLIGEAAETILDSVADGVFAVDKDWRITFFNRAAENITGISRKQAMGSICCDVFRANVCKSSCVLRKTMISEKPIVNHSIFIVDCRGQQVPISVSTALLRDAQGKIIGGVETFRDLSLVEELKKDIQGRHQIENIITVSPKMSPALHLIPLAAESNSTVLILGESGVGKELIAGALHHLSPRKSKPMITVNCGAIPEPLLESELFGYKAGAFTDAKKDKLGRFALAEGGTLFLDEIGDLPLSIQVKLLRVLQERIYEPLGGTKPVKANVRIISATNKDLQQLISENLFRKDLYFRVNVIKIHVPPLRERVEDIAVLVEHFIQKFNRLRDFAISGISHDALDLLMAHDFPGNVRELENIIEYAFVLCHKGVIKKEHLPPELRGIQGKAPHPAKSLHDLESEFFREQLRRYKGNKRLLAKELGIHSVTLWRKLKKLGI